MLGTTLTPFTYINLFLTKMLRFGAIIDPHFIENGTEASRDKATL